MERGLIAIAAALAAWTGIMTCIGQGNIGTAAVNGVSRNPEADGKIRTTMVLALAFAETGGIYGLLIAFITLLVY